jgi:bifunctional DNase/RNase
MCYNPVAAPLSRPPGSADRRRTIMNHVAGGCRRRLADLSSVGDAAMPVSMELSRIIISEVNDQQVIYLKEVDGERTFPILIGIFEATSIDRRVKGYPSPRPLTHDLIVNVVENLGGEFQDVVINELKDHTYYARLRVRHDGELVEIDARPSDAIAVAVTCNPPLPIYVNEDVLNDVLGEQQ